MPRPPGVSSMARPVYVYEDEFTTAVWLERKYQQKKWKEHELSHDMVEWTAILAKKVGDLASAALGGKATTERDTIPAQLAQIAAVATAAYISHSIIQETRAEGKAQ